MAAAQLPPVDRSNHQLPIEYRSPWKKRAQKTAGYGFLALTICTLVVGFGFIAKERMKIGLPVTISGVSAAGVLTIGYIIFGKNKNHNNNNNNNR